MATVIDPYEIPADVQVKTKEFKLPDSPKKLEFFSKAGKVRLLRIWEEKNLDNEILFTGWVGPSDTFVKEQVSDYVQHYLFRRSRRLSIDRLGGKKTITGVNLPSNQRTKFFMEYENHIDSLNKEVDKSRADKETERVKTLLVAGKAKIVPEGFEYIIDDSIFRCNRMMERVHALEKIKFTHRKQIPFKIPNVKPIKPICRDFQKTPKKIKKCLEDEVDEESELLFNIKISSPKSPFSDVQSLSSGFQEISPSPIQLDYENDAEGIPQSALSKEGYFIEFPSVRSQSSNTLVSEISDESLSICAEDHYPAEDFSGDLEINFDLICESEPVALIKKENTCSSMYATATKVIGMYERQEVAGMEFLEELAVLHSGK